MDSVELDVYIQSSRLQTPVRSQRAVAGLQHKIRMSEFRKRPRPNRVAVARGLLVDSAKRGFIFGQIRPWKKIGDFMPFLGVSEEISEATKKVLKIEKFKILSNQICLLR